MVKHIHLSRIEIRGISRQTDYATSEALVESLSTLRATHSIPIDKYIRDLLEQRVDSISFTKDRPYYYFHARRFEASLSFTIKDSEKIIDFSVPLREVEKMLTA